MGPPIILPQERLPLSFALANPEYLLGTLTKKEGVPII